MGDMMCKCCDETTTRAAMEGRHGTADEFEDAVLAALDMVTIAEARTAIARYRDQLRAAIADGGT